jgi:3-oxoacyl-[acyl-carrier-protein] synthase-3
MLPRGVGRPEVCVMSQSLFCPPGARISGTGVCVPERVVTNADLAASVNVSPDWIVERTGIRERRLVRPGQRTVELATEAAARALADAGLRPQDIDLLVLCTITAEMVTPGSACRIVANLGAVPCGAVDLSVACSGFVTGLNFAASSLRTGAYRHILVVGAEVLSEIVDWSDPRTAPLFGDAAGAAVVSPTDDARQGCLYQKIGSDARRWHELYLARVPSDVPCGVPVPDRLGVLRMDGPAVFRFAVGTFQHIVQDALKTCGLRPEQVKRYALHQANGRILEKVRTSLNLTREQVPINIDRYGNTSAASVALVLHEMHANGELTPGDLVLFGAVGGGMTWATSLWRF